MQDKTDKLDAHTTALYGQKMKPEVALEAVIRRLIVMLNDGAQ